MDQSALTQNVQLLPLCFFVFVCLFILPSCVTCLLSSKVDTQTFFGGLALTCFNQNVMFYVRGISLYVCVCVALVGV